tara:strand:- start:175 stop:741 length:567 start_codon:yes stop_codon:yes gene_type:complete
MDLKTRLNSHPVSTLKKEISKSNVKGYSKMKKAEVVALMVKHPEKFDHIKVAPEKEKKAAKVKAPVEKKEKKGNVEKITIKGKEYFYNPKSQKIFDIDTKKRVGDMKDGQVVMKALKAAKPAPAPAAEPAPTPKPVGKAKARLEKAAAAAEPAKKKKLIKKAPAAAPAAAAPAKKKKFIIKNKKAAAP